MTKNYTEDSSRPHGKRTAAIAEFIALGMEGKSIVYATPNGTFYSPKAVENLIRITLAEHDAGLSKAIEDVLEAERNKWSKRVEDFGSISQVGKSARQRVIAIDEIAQSLKKVLALFSPEKE